MSALLASIGRPEIVAGLIVLALNAYALMGGADFGGGVWDLLARGPRGTKQRELIAGTLAPIWEANHVWLIIVVMMLFTAFPSAFSTLSTVLHVPLTLMLLGIVMRGSAFVFRSYGSATSGQRHRWGLAFAIASIITPLLFGVVIGTVASGAAGAAAERVAVGSFREVYVAPWLSPFPLAVGAMALSLFAFLAAVYLTMAARDRELQEDFRRRALWASAAVFVTALGVLLLSGRMAPRVGKGLVAAPWSVPLQIATALAAVSAIAGLWRRRYAAARMAAAAQVSLILWGWALAQFPLLVPPAMSIRSAAAPALTLELLLYGLAAGAVVLIPSLVYLFRTFASAQNAEPGR